VFGPGAEVDSLVGLWGDSWHQQPAPMSMTGAVVEDSAELVGDYGGGWRWRIVVRAVEGSALTIQMDNVIPTHQGTTEVSRRAVRGDADAAATGITVSARSSQRRAPALPEADHARSAPRHLGRPQAMEAPQCRTDPYVSMSHGRGPPRASATHAAAGLFQQQAKAATGLTQIIEESGSPTRIVLLPRRRSPAPAAPPGAGRGDAAGRVTREPLEVCHHRHGRVLGRSCTA